MNGIPIYKPSGKFELVSIPLALIAGLLTAAIAGWLYQAFVDFVPFIYINAIMTAMLGLAIGVAVGAAAKKGKCRNVMLAVVLAAVCALAGDAITFQYAYNRTMTKVAKGISKRRAGKTIDMARLKKIYTIKRYIKQRVKSGWKIKGSRMSGVMVYIFWGIEALILLVTAGFMASTMVEEPYCERSNQWTEEEELGVIGKVDEQYVRQTIEQNALNPLLDAQSVPLLEDSGHTLTYTLYHCNHYQTGFLTLKLQWAEQNSKGEDEVQDHTLVEYAVLEVSQIAMLRGSFGAA